VKVAWFKKKHTTSKKHVMIFRRFGDKNQAKTDRKIRKTKCATKVDENMVPGITFWAKG